MVMQVVITLVTTAARAMGISEGEQTRPTDFRSVSIKLKTYGITLTSFSRPAALRSLVRLGWEAREF